MARIIEAFTQFLDNAGDPLIDGKLYFYEPGSTTPKNTYRDVGETTNSVNTNPVLLSGAGRSPDIFGSGSYRVIVTDRNDVQIAVADPVGGVGTQEFGANWNSLVTYQVGDIVRDTNVYYKGQSANNLGNQPSLDGGSNWATWPPNTQDAEVFRDEAEAARDAAALSATDAATSETNAATSETNAAASAAAAASSATTANFVGEWSSLTGVLNVPAVVLHNNVYWNLLVNLPDVTASEPSDVNPDWARVTSLNPIEPYSETLAVVSLEDIDLTAGNYFTKTLSANTTFTFSNSLTNASSFTLRLQNAATGGYTVVWPVSVAKWKGGAAPTLTDDDLLVFVTEDNGTSYYGVYVGELAAL